MDDLSTDELILEFDLARIFFAEEEEEEEEASYVVSLKDITERKRAERLIEDERNLLRSIINAIPDEIVVKDPERKFVLANEGCLRALGKNTMDEVVGLRDEDLVPEPFVRDAREKEIHVLTSGETLLNDMPEPRRNPNTGELERAIMSTKTPLHDSSGRLVGLVVVNRDITDLHRTQEMLSQSETRFRAVWDHSLDANRLTDAEGTIVMVNQSYCQLFKKGSEELVGRSLAEPYLPKPDENIVGDYCERFRNRTIAPFREVEVTVWNAEELCVEISNAFLPVPNQPELLLSVFRDITERKRAEAALRASQEQFRIAQDMSPDGFTILQPVRDAQERVVDFTWIYENAAVARLNGTDPEAVVGKRLLELFPGHRGTPILRAYQQVAESRETCTFEADYSGESMPKPTLFRIVVVPMAGNIAILAQDITERKRAEERLIATQEQLHSLAGHLQSVREEERKHLAQEFHDQLGQTLTAIKMDLSMLHRAIADPGKEPSRSVLAQGIESSQDMIDRAIAIIREILSELRPELLDQLGIVPTLEWEVEKFQRKSGMSCTFSSSVEAIALDAKIAIAVYRIFQEAVTNVARHAKATHVAVSLRREGTYLVLEIEDDGVGISADVEQRARSFGLIGMRERAILLGGTLEIRGVEGKGTRVLARILYEQTLADGGAAL